MQQQADEIKNSRRVGKVQDRESTKNKLNLGQFHRNATFKQKNNIINYKTKQFISNYFDLVL